MHFSHKFHRGHGPHDREHFERNGHPQIHFGFPFGGGKRERVFASGDMKFVILHLLGQKPAHGYEIIKALGEWVGGDYTPSPGTVYPTLTLLEDMGWVVSRPQDGRREYCISVEGRAQLEEQRGSIERILAHLAHVRNHAHGRRMPEVMRAMENLKMSLRMRLGDEVPDPEITRRISEIIDHAAVEIERC